MGPVIDNMYFGVNQFLYINNIYILPCKFAVLLFLIVVIVNYNSPINASSVLCLHAWLTICFMWNIVVIS